VLEFPSQVRQFPPQVREFPSQIYQTPMERAAARDREVDEWWSKYWRQHKFQRGEIMDIHYPQAHRTLDYWIIENDALSGSFEGHKVHIAEKEGKELWEKITKMDLKQKRAFWASQPTWKRRVALVLMLGREPMAHEVAEPFFIGSHMHAREEKPPVVLYGYNCQRRWDQSTLCTPK